MSFSLGQAKLILDLNAQPLIEAEAVAWKSVRQGAQAVTTFLAQQNNVRVSDVKKAASLILAENKKAASEILKTEKALADDRKRTTQEYIRINKQLIKEEEAEAKRTAKEKAKAEREAAEDRKKTTKAYLAANKQLIKEEEAERRKLEQTLKNLDKERERAAQQSLRVEILAQRKKAAEAKAIAQQEARDRIAAQQQSSSVGVLGIPGGPSTAKVGATAATLLGFGAIASGALVLREATLSLVEATTKHDQAQRALNGAFGEGASRMRALSEQYAKQYGLVTSTVEKAITTFGTLDKQTNLTSTQLKQLSERAIDVEAAFGGGLQEAFRSAAGAILGETEAFEKFGVVLQDDVLKTLPQLTEFQRKNFETLSVGEKQQIRFKVLMELTAGSIGTAAKRAQEAQGQFQAFERATDEFAKTSGKTLIPFLGEAVEWITKYVNKGTELVKTQQEINDAINQLAEEQGGPVVLDDDGGRRVSERVEINRRRAIIDQETKDIEDARKERISNRNKELKEQTDIENANVKRRGDIIERELKEAADLELRRIEERKKAAEADERILLDGLERRHKAELELLEQTEYARKQAHADELARVEKEKDVAIQAAEDKKDAAIQALDAERDAVHDTTNENIRQLEIARDTRLKEIEEVKEAALDAVQDEERARKHARTNEDRDIADRLEREQREREDNYKKTTRNIEDEADKLREKHEDEVKRLDRLGAKEDARHTKRVRQLEDEAQAAEEYGSKQIRLIQKQIDLLDAQKKAEDNRRRNRDLAQKQEDARQNLSRVSGRGTPDEIVAARGKLTAAIRIGDPEAVKKAQAELVEVAGRGAEAIAQAQRELQDIQTEIADENVDQARDAEKDKLIAAKDAIEEETKLRKQNIDKQQVEEKRAEDNRTKRRKDALDKDKEASKDRLDDALKKLETRKRAEADAYEKDKRGAEDAKETAQRALADRRRSEDEAHADKIEKINKEAKDAIEATRAIYDDEATGLIPALKRALDAYNRTYDERKNKVEQTYKDERKEIYETYDNPETGLLATLRRADEQAQRSYSLQTAAAKARYDAEKEQIKTTYRALDGKSGILDQLDALKTNTENALKDDLLEWEKWKDGLVGPNGIQTRTWADAKAQFDAFLNDIKNRGGVTIRPRVVVETVQANPPTNTPGSGIQIGPDDNLPGSTNRNGGGIGTTPDPQGTTSNSGTPDPEANQTPSLPPDEISNMFTEAFGYGAKYSGNFQSGPGWQGGAAWPGGPSHHKGVDLILPGARNGYGKPVPAFHAGRVLRTVADSSGPGGNMVIIEDSGGRTHWYLHLKDYTVRSGQQVKRGDIIAHLGDTGTEEFPHLHYEVRRGDNNGPMSYEALRRDGIDPNGFIKGRDKGYLFQHPTLYKDTVTGEVGVMAEKAPERLLGSLETRRYDSRPYSPEPSDIRMDYSKIGAALVTLGGRSQVATDTGDTMIYNGVAPDSLMQQWRDDQRRQRVLRGG